MIQRRLCFGGNDAKAYLKNLGKLCEDADTLLQVRDTFTAKLTEAAEKKDVEIFHTVTSTNMDLYKEKRKTASDEKKLSIFSKPLTEKIYKS
jgi:hypothetical protein